MRCNRDEAGAIAAHARIRCPILRKCCPNAAELNTEPDQCTGLGFFRNNLQKPAVAQTALALALEGTNSSLSVLLGLKFADRRECAAQDEARQSRALLASATRRNFSCHRERAGPSKRTAAPIIDRGHLRSLTIASTAAACHTQFCPWCLVFGAQVLESKSLISSSQPCDPGAQSERHERSVWGTCGEFEKEMRRLMGKNTALPIATFGRPFPQATGFAGSSTPGSAHYDVARKMSQTH